MIARTLKDHDASGKAITFGVQGVEGQYEQIVRLLEEEDYRYSALQGKDIVTDNITQFGNSIHQKSLFNLFGYSKVESLDYFDSEKPDHVLNLNKPIPENMQCKYNLV